MYISIDMEALRFLHKHPNPHTVADLDFICGKGKKVSMGPCGEPAIFKHMTFLEKEKLFKNTTGKDPSTATPAYDPVLAELAEMMPVTDANSFEADRQATWLEQKYEIQEPVGYIYVRGATLPTKGQELLFPAVTITPDQCAVAMRKAAAAAPRPTPATTAPAPVAPAQKPRTAPAQRPRSGVCAQIWEALDKEKAATGECPTRDRVKQLAQEHGWNPSTASVQSAAWRRENNFA